MELSHAPLVTRLATREQSRAMKITPWLVLNLAAGAVLATGFLLPAFGRQACAPLKVLLASLWGYPAQCEGPTVVLCYGFFTCAASHVLGILVVAGSAGVLAGRPGFARLASTAIALLLLSVAAGMLWTAPVAYMDQALNVQWWPAFLTMAVGLAIPAYVVSAGRLGTRASLCYRFAGSMAATVFFISCTLFTAVSYGMYISLIASALLLVSTVGEACVVTRRRWGDVVWQLTTCNLRDRSNRLRPPPAVGNDGSTF